jgi:hypothetical protein
MKQNHKNVRRDCISIYFDFGQDVVRICGPLISRLSINIILSFVNTCTWLLESTGRVGLHSILGILTGKKLKAFKTYYNRLLWQNLLGPNHIPLYTVRATVGKQRVNIVFLRQTTQVDT